MIDPTMHDVLLRAHIDSRHTVVARYWHTPRHAHDLGIVPAPGADGTPTSRRRPRMALAGILGIAVSVVAGFWAVTM